MNISEVLQNSNLLVIRALDGLPEEEWDVPGACGDWSVKDIVAHMASYEHIIIDVINTFQGGEPTPAIDQWVHSRATFNAIEVESRKYATAQQVMDEFQGAQVEATSLIMQIPPERARQTGAMPWYGKEYSLADFISQAYEHMREHCSQITLFHSRIKAEMENDSSAT